MDLHGLSEAEFFCHFAEFRGVKLHELYLGLILTDWSLLSLVINVSSTGLGNCHVYYSRACWRQFSLQSMLCKVSCFSGVCYFRSVQERYVLWQIFPSFKATTQFCTDRQAGPLSSHSNRTFMSLTWLCAETTRDNGCPVYTYFLMNNFRGYPCNLLQ